MRLKKGILHLADIDKSKVELSTIKYIDIEKTTVTIFKESSAEQLIYASYQRALNDYKWITIKLSEREKWMSKQNNQSLQL